MLEMRKTYIATTQEAKALHDGTQTAIISKMRVQPDENGVRYMPNPQCLNWEQIYKERWKPYILTTNEGEDIAVDPPYAIGQEVVVREVWAETCDEYGAPIIAFKDGGAHYIGPENEYLAECKSAWSIDNYPSCGKWRSPATMPLSAARTRFRIVSCEAVRVQSILGNSGLLYPLTCGKDGIECGRNLYKHSVHKLGQSAWDNNDYIFYYKIDKA